MDDVLAGFSEAREVGTLLGGLSSSSSPPVASRREGSRTFAELLGRVNWSNAADFRAPSEAAVADESLTPAVTGRPGSWQFGDLLGRVNWKNSEDFVAESTVLAELDESGGGSTIEQKSELEVGGFFDEFQW